MIKIIALIDVNENLFPCFKHADKVKDVLQYFNLEQFSEENRNYLLEYDVSLFDLVKDYRDYHDKPFRTIGEFVKTYIESMGLDCEIESKVKDERGKNEIDSDVLDKYKTTFLSLQLIL